jgi:hypothetical protein
MRRMDQKIFEAGNQWLVLTIPVNQEAELRNTAV